MFVFFVYIFYCLFTACNGSIESLLNGNEKLLNEKQLNEQAPTSILAPLDTSFYKPPNGYAIELVQCAVPNCRKCEQDYNTCSGCFDDYVLKENNCISLSTHKNLIDRSVLTNIQSVNRTISKVFLKEAVNTSVPCPPNISQLPKDLPKLTHVQFETNITTDECRHAEEGFKKAVQRTLKQAYVYIECDQVKIICEAAYVQDLAEFGVSVTVVKIDISNLSPNDHKLAITSLDNSIGKGKVGESFLLDYLQDFSPGIFLRSNAPIIATTSCHQKVGQFCLPLGVSNAWCCGGHMSCIEGKCTDVIVVTEQPTVAPTPAPAKLYTQRLRSHCGSILAGTFSSYNDAVAACNGNSMCFGVYDNQCDNEEPFYMCGGPHTWEISPASCVYQKVTPIKKVRAGEVCGGISCEEVILSFGVPCSTSWKDGCGHVPPPKGFSQNSIMYDLCPVMCPGKRISFSLELSGVMFDAVDSTMANLKVVLQSMFLRDEVSVKLAQINLNTTIVEHHHGKISLNVDIVHLTPPDEVKVIARLKDTFKNNGSGMSRLLKEAAIDKFKDLQVRFVHHVTSNSMPTPKQKGEVKQTFTRIYHRTRLFPKYLLGKSGKSGSTELIEVQHRLRSIGRQNRTIQP